MKKKAYRIQNWTQYSKALVQRGSLTLWFYPDSIEAWYHSGTTSKRGRPHVYSNIAIQCCLTLKAVFHLPLRATQGLADSLLKLMQLPTAPDYSLLSLRQRQLNIKLPKRNPVLPAEAIHLVVDSTGLKL